MQDALGTLDGFEGAGEISRSWFEAMRPDPALTVSEWADKHRLISQKTGAEHGRWKTSRTPYLREIMDALSPTSPIERVVFMKGAQIGATESGNNWIGYIIHHAPGPMMAVWPTVEMAKRTSKQRIDPMILETPELSRLITPARTRDSGNTQLSKDFRGGVLVMTGANSAVGLRSMSVRYLFLDEVDGYPSDVGGEGDAIKLAEARTRTFARKKIYVVSTPTIAGASAIEREYEESDQRRYHVSCPHCGTFQVLKFERLRWEKGNAKDVSYHCDSCETPIYEHYKTEMLQAGQWRATRLDYTGRTAGFHLSSLYSPLGWRSWADIAKAWDDATDKESGNVSAIKTFKNTDLGETWSEEGEAPDWQRLLERREDYPIGQVPAAALLLTAGVDIQKDRIEASVWGWGRAYQSWLIEHRIILGDTSRDDVWQQLAAVINERWDSVPNDDGEIVPLALSRVAVDTGYATQHAYKFVRSLNDSRVVAIKGSPRGASIIGSSSAVETNVGGKRLKSGIRLFPVAGSIAKLELYANLRKGADIATDANGNETNIYPVGFVHLPKVDAEFVKQLCAEQLVTRRNRAGFAVREWEKMRERNEALDCYVYARAAAALYGIDRFSERHWAELEKSRQTDDVEPDEDPIVQIAAPQRQARRVIKSGWFSR